MFFFFREHGPRVTGSLVQAVLENYEELILTSSSGPLNCGYTLKGGLLGSLQNIDLKPLSNGPKMGNWGYFTPKSGVTWVWDLTTGAFGPPSRWWDGYYE